MNASLVSFADELVKIAEETASSSSDSKPQEWKAPTWPEYKELIKATVAAGLGSGIGYGLGYIAAPKILPPLLEKLGPEKFKALMGMSGAAAAALGNLTHNIMLERTYQARRKEEERRRVETERKR